MKIMAVDYGDARTGLAVCDRTELLASPVGTIHDRSFANVINQVAAAAVEFDVKEIVVGHPRNMDGSEGPRAQKCADFADKLQLLVQVPVRLWDERSTTVSAHNILNVTDTRGKKRKEVIDEVAATLILESYMLYRQHQKAKEQEEQK